MEIREETLQSRLRKGRLSPSEAAQVAAYLARYLSSMHSGGEPYLALSPRTVVIDSALKVHLLARGAGQGGGQDLAYRAPEQLRGEPGDWRSDCWSVGALLYLMLTGEAPFQGSTEEELRNAILLEEPAAATLPADAERALRRTLAKSPDDRYERTDDLVRDLDLLCRLFLSTSPLAGGVPAPSEGSRPAESPSQEWLRDESLPLPAEGDLLQRLRTKRSKLARREMPSWWAVSALPLAVILVLGATLLYCGTRVSEQRSRPSSESFAVTNGLE